MSEKARFSGYVVAAGCALTLFLNIGCLGCFGVFLPRIVQTEGYQFGAVLLMSTFATVSAFLMNTFGLSKVVAKFGPKITLLVGSLGLSVMMVIFGASTSIYMIYFGGIIGGISMSLSMQAPVAMLIANWFVEKRASVTSITFTGMSFGAAALIFLAGQLLANYNWRTVYFILAAIQAVLVVVVNVVLIKDSPEKIGQKPLGYDKEMTSTGASAAAGKSGGPAKDVPYLKTAAFIVLYVGLAER